MTRSGLETDPEIFFQFVEMLQCMTMTVVPT